MISPQFDNRYGPQPPPRGRIRYPSYAGPITILAGSLQTATQYAAHNLSYPPELGPHLHRIYPPWALIDWSEYLSQAYPAVLEEAINLGLSSAALGMLGLLMIRGRGLDAPYIYLHGSARWANQQDLERAGLLPRPVPLYSRLLRLPKTQPSAASAVVVGAWRSARGRVQYLLHGGPEHVLAIAPTRSGKGVGLVVPTLLTWLGSALILDIKGELHALTSGWRHKHANQTVLRLNFATLRGTVHWNPLEEVRIGTEHEVGDVQNLALLLVDPDGKGIEGDHWRSTAMGLLTGVILHLLHRREPEQPPPCLADVVAYLSDPTRPPAERWQEMVRSAVIAVAAEGSKMLSRPEEEAGSVLSTAERCLSLFHDPVVAENTHRSDFRIHDLMNAERPISLYLTPSPTDKDRLRPLLRIFISMILRLLASRMDFEGGRPKPHYKHKLLLMLDEFPVLKRLNILQEALGYVAGYGIKCYLICQDYDQLQNPDDGYGHNETITGNCHIQAILRPDKLATAKAISEKTGQTTIRQTQVTRSGKGIFASTSRTDQYVQRPLLTPDECMRLPGAKTEGDKIVQGGDMLVFAAGMPVARGPQPLYFQDPVFAARAAVEAPATAYAGAK